jgi:Membrane bound beta barrel domain (DUF5777)
MKKIVLILIFSTCWLTKLSAQDDLMSLLDEEPPKEYSKNAFKSTRVINSHSLEFLGKQVLDVRILHRFGRINGGAYEAFGIDQARVRLGLDYGITPRLMVGIGRSSYKKEADAFAKYRILWQSTGKKSIPFSMIWVSGITDSFLKWENPDRKNYYTSRLSYYHQLIIGRKFSERLSWQISPTLVHRNIVKTAQDKHDILAIGTGGRIKLTRRVAVTIDYYYQLPKQGLPPEIKQPLSIGFDIETGGHVFQLHFTNALGMNERILITESDGKWDKGDVHFGFNISRVFSLGGKH